MVMHCVRSPPTPDPSPVPGDSRGLRGPPDRSGSRSGQSVVGAAATLSGAPRLMIRLEQVAEAWIVTAAVSISGSIMSMLARQQFLRLRGGTHRSLVAAGVSGELSSRLVPAPRPQVPSPGHDSSAIRVA